MTKQNRGSNYAGVGTAAVLAIVGGLTFLGLNKYGEYNRRQNEAILLGESTAQTQTLSSDAYDIPAEGDITESDLEYLLRQLQNMSFIQTNSALESISQNQNITPSQTNNTYTTEQVSTNKPAKKADVKSAIPGRVDYLFSNKFFENSGYLNETQIRDFLKKKKSCLYGLEVEKTIVESAKRHKINPLVLLARLQTEQSLVERRTATPNQLKYATGHGVFDNGTKLASSGIHDQIEDAAGTLRKHYDLYKAGKIVKIDYSKTQVAPKNAATYASLRYTPHTHGSTLNTRVAQKYINHFQRR